jgi:hypothetical protein
MCSQVVMPILTNDLYRGLIQFHSSACWTLGTGIAEGKSTSNPSRMDNAQRRVTLQYGVHERTQINQR